MAEREIGRGGWAIVYLARDLKNRRRVALKVMRPEIAEGLGGDRFLREIEISANLTHPNILPLHDSGEADGLLYYVMPYVEGESLRQRINREKQLPLEAVWDIARELTDALAYAHSKGVVHRDIKPENVLLQEGHAVISDFGIARAVSVAGGEDITETGIAVGTPLYMSPEQGTGEADLDSRSDIYSLGCCVWEMLAGDPPHTGPTAQAILARKAAEPLPSLRTVRETVPEEIEQAISKALARVPADRYSTAHEFHEALASGMRKSAQLRAVRQRQRWFALLAIVGIIAVAAAVQLIREASRVKLEPNRVVVAVFEDQSDDPSLRQLGGIAADRITSGLMTSDILDVVQPPTARGAWEFVQERLEQGEAYDPIGALAEATGAGIVVTGSYYSVGDSVRLQAEVTDVVRGRALGSVQPTQGPVADPSQAVDGLQNQIRGLLAVTFDPRLAPSVGAGSRPPDYEAYRAFSDGMDHYVDEEWAAAVPHFAQAYALDSNFIRALLYQAVSHSNLRAYAEADSVLHIAARHRDQLTAYLRHFLDYRLAFLAGDGETQLRAVRRAAEIAPGSKAVFNHALVAWEQNRLREAREILESLDPEHGPMRGWFTYWRILANTYHVEGDFRHELRTAQSARELFAGTRHVLQALQLELRGRAALGETSAVDVLLAEARRADESGRSVGPLISAAARELRAHGHAAAARAMFERAADWYQQQPPEVLETRERWDHARVLYALQRWEEAEALSSALAAEHPDDIRYRAHLGLIAARRGDRAAAGEVEAWLAQLEDRYRFGGHTYYRATIAAVLGEAGQAVTLLREAFGQGYPQGSMQLHQDTNLESLQHEPRYLELMEPKP